MPSKSASEKKKAQRQRQQERKQVSKEQRWRRLDEQQRLAERVVSHVVSDVGGDDVDMSGTGRETKSQVSGSSTAAVVFDDINDPFRNVDLTKIIDVLNPSSFSSGGGGRIVRAAAAGGSGSADSAASTTSSSETPEGKAERIRKELEADELLRRVSITLSERSQVDTAVRAPKPEPAHSAPAAAASADQPRALSKAELNGMRVPELRRLCLDLSLDSKGNKGDLVDRICTAQVSRPSVRAEAPSVVAPKSSFEDVKISADLLREFARVRQAFETRGAVDDSSADADAVASDSKDGILPATADEFLASLADEVGDCFAISNKQRRKTTRLGIAALKQLVARPDLVESWDVNAADPSLLLHLKGYRHAVPVPRHWSQPGKYLQNQRGSAKARYELPDYIEATGIARMRGAMQEEEEEKSLRQTQRGKLLPRMHRMDIDYQVLHDAFFRHQTKPPLLGFGDAYFEGKETDSSAAAAQASSKFRPGVLSAQLRKALDMPSEQDEIAAGTPFPPPWLVNMQRAGPPPAYPQLRVPGVNAPLPAGATWGFHAGGWGRPPLDANNRPLFGGDPMGQNSGPSDRKRVPVYKVWGALDDEEWAGGEDQDDGPLEDADDAAATSVASDSKQRASTYGGYGFDADAASDAEGDDFDFDFSQQQSAGAGRPNLMSGMATPSLTTESLRKTTGAETPSAPWQRLDEKPLELREGSMNSARTAYVMPGAKRPLPGGDDDVFA